MAKRRVDIRTKKFIFDDRAFNMLMRIRIHHVLLVASTYDTFILEDDGRINEQIFNEYVSLKLSYPPQFIQATTQDQVFKILSEEKIDLVIIMIGTEEHQAFGLISDIKKKYANIPVVLLTPFSCKISNKIKQENLNNIDYIFSWLGNADILMAIIKLIEDKMNVEHDVKEVGVQIIILVEDNIRFYSSYLPNIYKIIFKQSRSFISEALNEHQKMLRMRGRPKILLATNFEEAMELYEKYKKNLLGVISDIHYERESEMDVLAGIRLCEKIKSDDKFIPILLQSSNEENEELAKNLKIGFINKNSQTLSIELRNFISEHFAFGDFVFINPNTFTEIARAKDLKAMQEIIFSIPNESIAYHIEHNHFSKWMRARALFPLAELMVDLRPEDFSDIDEVKRFISNAIASFRLSKSRGIIAQFDRKSFDEYLTFTRIGEGSIGGKARGLAFLDSMIKRNNLNNKYDGVSIIIPRTVVLSMDIFDEYMEENNFHKIPLSKLTDQKILEHFIGASLPLSVNEDLYTYISYARNPIAIRSSSLLEDSYYQPFAGIYSTYMIPVVPDNERLMIEMLGNAIKGVYASAFFKASKSFMSSTLNIIDEEKMGVVLQEVCGKAYGNKFYPIISGVARSLNFYPIELEKPEDGIANIALGLGKYIVEGGLSLRFSPRYPKKILQLHNPEIALQETQKYFFALDLDHNKFKISTDDTVNLKKISITEAENDGSLKHIASTYDFQNHIIRDGGHFEGKKLITFSNILKHNIFPLAEIIKDILYIGEKEMGKPIEIEFAVELSNLTNEPVIFNLLQIRPIVYSHEIFQEDLSIIDHSETIISANSALGNGITKNIRDFVYVKPESFDSLKSKDIALRVEKINDFFLKTNKHYILAGPGRWGSNDPNLGIPVKWPQISEARVIVESGLENYRIDPSQGTHFFQNLTALRVGYFTINPYIQDGFYDLGYLANFNPFYEDEFIRHIRFDKPLTVKIDGKKNKGVILKEGIF